MLRDMLLAEYVDYVNTEFPKTAAEIAKETSTHPDIAALQRFLLSHERKNLFIDNLHTQIKMAGQQLDRIQKLVEQQKIIKEYARSLSKIFVLLSIKDAEKRNVSNTNDQL